MKKLLILGVLLLFAVSVAAQYTTVAVNPKIISKAIQPSGSCYDVCKRDCIAGQRADECAKVCDVKCNPKLQPTPVQEDCATKCRRLSSQVALTAANAGFNFDIFVKCMRDNCKQDCESSCRMMYGSQMMDCIQKYCRPQQPQPAETCEQGCGRKLDECMKTTVGMNIESIRAACEKLHNECMQEKCGRPPETCEQGCDKEYKVCLEKSVGLSAEGIRAGCENIRQKCVQDRCGGQEPCPPVDTCESRCGYSYHECIKSGRDQVACRNLVGECLDKCGGWTPPMNCPDKCRLIEKECLAANVDPESCGMKVKDCVTNCYPQPAPPQNCEDRCAEMEKRCDEFDSPRRETCLFDVRICKENCMKPQPPEQPDCPRLCERRHKECLASNVDPAKCSGDLKYCERLCGQGSFVSSGKIDESGFEESSGVDISGKREVSPQDLVGLNPQPEPPMPQPGFWARIRSWFTG